MPYAMWQCSVSGTFSYSHDEFNPSDPIADGFNKRLQLEQSPNYVGYFEEVSLCA